MITTNSNIKNYDLYNESNIFILSEENDNVELDRFLKSVFCKTNDSIIRKYNFVNWVSSFAGDR